MSFLNCEYNLKTIEKLREREKVDYFDLMMLRTHVIVSECDCGGLCEDSYIDGVLRGKIEQ